ncbi:MAG TPA: glycosyltransferase [Gammaproteobacteria bacterium]|nr:glycosyltransferase [Gammaproteobacteria bacterium]
MYDNKNFYTQQFPYMKPFPTRVFIIEPCLGKMTGHWESHCRRFYQELTRRGLETTIFCQADPDPQIVKDLNVVPIFTHSVFNSMPDQQAFENECDALTADLSKINSSTFTSEDLLIFTTIVPSFLKAAMYWLQPIIRPSGPKAAFIFMISAGDVSLHYPRFLYQLLKISSFYNPLRKYLIKKLYSWQDSAHINYYRSFQSAFKQKKAANSYYYFGCCEEFSINFERILNIKAQTLPMINVLSDRPVQKIKRKEIKIGYFGHASLEKGAQFLHVIVKKMLIKYPHTQFELHINPNIHTEELLKAFDLPIPNVRCHHGHLDYPSLVALMQEVDINFLPYTQTKYAAMPSSVFIEAICSENVVVIPNHTWMAREAANIQAGYVLFDRYDELTISNALDIAIENYATLKQKTKKAKNTFLEKNNLIKFMDRILQTMNT